MSALFTKRPAARLRLMRARPDLVFIRARKPMRRLRLRLEHLWG